MTESENSGMTEAELIRRLGELPKRVEPQNDPWPGIKSRITRQETRKGNTGAPWLRLAAAVALAFAVGIFLGKSWQSGPLSGQLDNQVTQNPERLNQVPNLGGTLMGTELEYQAAFSEFTTIGESATELKPATLEAIERDWQAMLDAEAALTAALDQYPNNPWLNKRMLELRDRQLGMLKQLAGLDRASRRTEI
ncbi:MAG TPA: hypothetical protein VJ984_10870 [Xanthomonadales bacterium]|nr:hypothetical protein [Xanthomonadales bacterium]